ncbi:MAG: uroporphyrinogen-III C-methyltransferase [Gammaproteobacteria bacterium]|nr:uroporphyrinogen-III C-methyltransferase [Gammaproteobacteria bacterium]
MKYLPLLFDITDKPCLIVGGGKIATRRAQNIYNANARVDVISVTTTDQIAQIATESGGKVILRSWHSNDIKTYYRFVVAATNDERTNVKIAETCKQLGIPVNVISDSTLSDFSFPAVIDRDPLTITVSSGSASPILTKLLAQRIDALIPQGYGKLATLIRRYRHKIRENILSPGNRKLFWERVLTGNIAEHIFSGNQSRAEELLLKSLTDPENTTPKGEVYLVGAGPGDPDLLTFRAYRLLQQSEIVLYDRLVSEKILSQIGSDKKMVYVGKQRSNHSVPQGDINQLLVDYAVAGKRVARLKGGDPFIFGRGGEEIELLASRQIPFQVVPGITAASGCASYSGIPLTHRDHAQSVRFVTGQLQDGTVDLPWDQLVAPNQTVVIYMGLNGLPAISTNLIRYGMNSETPAAMIEQGTTLDQKVHISTIAKLPDMVASHCIRPPTLLIVGSVVSLHHSLNWFGNSSPSKK